MLKTSLIAAALLVASATSAVSGTYDSGAQLGSAPTPAQQAFRDDQLRIRFQNDHLHESERRNGGLLVIKTTKHMWYSMRDSMKKAMAK